MRLDINYYFENPEADEVFKWIVDHSENVLDMFSKRDEFINKNIVEKDLKENHGQIDDTAKLKGNYYIGEGTKIEEGVVIEGPVYIGKNCEILKQAYIRPYTIMCDNCVVGFNSEVKKTLMQTGSKISSLAFAGDAILGKSTRIGSGAITANRRFDQKSIKLKQDDGTRLDTNLEFFGSIIGDSSRIGANAVTVPGTFIGPYSWVFPLTCARGFIPAQKRVYAKTELAMEENEKIELKKATWQSGK